MNKDIYYYLIHNLDLTRKNIMTNEFIKWNFDLNKIKWLNHPNKNEISDELLNSLIIHPPDNMFNGNYLKNNKGLVCCTYKHYLALKDIVDNNYEYGVVIEDNIYFKDNIPNLLQIYIKQLEENYEHWDILFEGEMFKYIEQPTKPDLLVYPKTNEITEQCHGGSRAATFYLIKKECAKKLIDNWIPFTHAPDWWFNYLFRKLDIKSFWVEPSVVAVQPNHISTCGN
jgi:GR25 family glycosyltransferase involved in LPS biosynthesis